MQLGKGAPEWYNILSLLVGNELTDYSTLILGANHTPRRIHSAHLPMDRYHRYGSVNNLLTPFGTSHAPVGVSDISFFTLASSLLFSFCQLFLISSLHRSVCGKWWHPFSGPSRLPGSLFSTLRWKAQRAVNSFLLYRFNPHLHTAFAHSRLFSLHYFNYCCNKSFFFFIPRFD